MARRKVEKTVKESAPSNQENQPQIEEPKHFSLIDQEVERQIVAIRSMRDVGIEHLLTELRLLRSYFSKEQLNTPALQFFKENLPNLSIERNEENGEFHVKWNDNVDDLSDGANINASLLRRLSLAYPSCSANLSVGRFGLSSDAVKTSIFGAADNLQMTDIVLEGQSDSQMLGMHDGLRTPGVTSQRLSIGMTPKTQRLPKRGEILLSVRGSPLGVFKEDNMEAINEHLNREFQAVTLEVDKLAGLSQAGVIRSTRSEKIQMTGSFLCQGNVAAIRLVILICRYLVEYPSLVFENAKIVAAVIRQL
ncbi:hypothetical protein POTOM_020887 [Populus tomentosa]|uniref:Uncharacterized protein n=1 Tax=Populus tomentosa TaxID=118781 RepID=A0A8X7ZSY1_POPTO|nr:hypothetical protein POTOM_020887 [Populus tomentosa]